MNRFYNRKLREIGKDELLDDLTFKYKAQAELIFNMIIGMGDSLLTISGRKFIKKNLLHDVTIPEANIFLCGKYLYLDEGLCGQLTRKLVDSTDQ